MTAITAAGPDTTTRLPHGPGKLATPLIMAGLLSEPVLAFRWCQRRFGDRFTLTLGRFGTIVVVADRDDAKEVFRGDPAVWHAGESNGQLLAAVLGATSVLVTDDALHRRQRRLLSPPFHGPAVAAQVAAMAEIAADEVDRWPVGRAFRAIERMQHITFEVILRTVIGATDPDGLAALRSALPPLVELSSFAMLQFVFPRLRTVWPWRRFAAVQARVDAVLADQIAATRADPALDRRTDVLAMLVRATDEDGSSLSDTELRDQLVTILVAGHETTATGLAWALERLTRTPAALADAVAAADAGDDAGLDAVVAEALRARPVVSDVMRRLTASARLADLELPAGVSVDVALVLIQRDPRWWPEPERFDPGRFADAKPDLTTWMPFGGGGRRCVGAAFAQVEMRTILGEVLRRVELAPTTARAERARAKHVTMVPSRGATVTVAARRHHGRAAPTP